MVGTIKSIKYFPTNLINCIFQSLEVRIRFAQEKTNAQVLFLFARSNILFQASLTDLDISLEYNVMLR